MIERANLKIEKIDINKCQKRFYISKMGMLMDQNTFKTSPTVKTLWPVFFSYSIIALTFAAYILNMINFSNIIWPGEPFHALEMGIIITMRLWAVAFSGMIIGALTDRVSRKILLIFAKNMISTMLVFGQGAGLM